MQNCIKDKEEKERLIIDECLFRNAFRACFFNLIREESKNLKKVTSDNAEKLENHLFKE